MGKNERLTNTLYSRRVKIKNRNSEFESFKHVQVNQFRQIAMGESFSQYKGYGNSKS